MPPYKLINLGAKVRENNRVHSRGLLIGGNGFSHFLLHSGHGLGKAYADPSPMFWPIPANTFEGELILSRLLAPSTMPEKKPDTFSSSHEARDLMPSHRPVTMFLPISNTAPTAFPKLLTMAAIICDSEATSCGIALINPAAS